MFFFGPESEKPPPQLPEETLPSALSPNESAIATQKQFRDALLNGAIERTAAAVTAQLAPKRGRKTATSSERNGSVARKPSISANRAVNTAAMDIDMVNGHILPPSDARSPSATEPGPDDAVPLMNGIKADERMDLDEESLIADQPNHEPHIEAVPLPVYTLNTGASVGVQVPPAKVANLAQSANILNVPPSTNDAVSKSLTRIAWHPRNSMVLAAMGDDFCDIWDFGASSRFQRLVESTEAKLTSAVSWEPHGDMLALATYTNESGHIHIFDGQELCILEDLTASQRAVTCMLWHSHGSNLYGIAPYDSEDVQPIQTSGSSIVQWDYMNVHAGSAPSTIIVPEILMDMDGSFIDDNGIICAAGQKAVYCCRTSPGFGIEQKWMSGPTSNDQWTFVRCAWRGDTNLILIAASADTGSLWMPAQNLSRRGAHDAPITCLELRPRLSNGFSHTWKAEFATSSMDGTVRVWRYDEDNNAIDSVCKLIIGHGSPVMAVAYSPDGFCLAGASYDIVRIWNAEHGHNHMATWKDDSGLWDGSKLKDDDMISLGGRSSVNGDASQPSTDHTLKWDASSMKLAFGLASQVRSDHDHIHLESSD